MTDMPKVTFGFVNCNRLHYLRSCVESLLTCISDYEGETEFIVVDNASVESGTEDYLNELESRGFQVFRRDKRDPANEFAAGLNTIVEESSGEFVVPLQSDMQFVLHGGWLREYVKYAQSHSSIVGCLTLDAQRTITNSGRKFAMDQSYESNYQFLVDMNRDPVAGAADVMYPRHVLDKIYPWHTQNRQHEGGEDSETAMLKKVRGLMNADQTLQWHCVVPVVPPAIAIYTDARGTNARVRGNRRYGDYWAPKEDSYRYYELIPFEHVVKKTAGRSYPVGIEEMVNPVGFPKFVDEHGHWLKNPIRPETALASDYVELNETMSTDLDTEISEDSELTGWLNS